jgi:putative acetyltransferase
VFVADREDVPVGFMTLAKGGYVDLAFLLPAARGQGRFAALLAATECSARQAGAGRLWTHASLMAEPAFARGGFQVMERETIETGGQRLARAKMEKILP